MLDNCEFTDEELWKKVLKKSEVVEKLKDESSQRSNLGLHGGQHYA